LKKTNSFKEIKPNPKIVRHIEGKISYCRDRIYEMTKEEKDSSIYNKYEELKNNIRIQIRECKKAVEHKSFPNGVYYGNIFRYSDNENNEDYFYIRCTIPSSHINKLICILSSNPNASLEITTDILSFSYEVDDSLRDHWMSRNLLIEDGTYAIISNINIKNKKISEVDNPKNSNIEEYNEKDGNYSNHPKNNNLKKSLSKITRVLWVIATILFFCLLK